MLFGVYLMMDFGSQDSDRHCHRTLYTGVRRVHRLSLALTTGTCVAS